MKKFSAFFLAGALLLPAMRSVASSFEGTVTMKMSGAKDEQMPMTYSLKNGMLRVDMVANDSKNSGKNGGKMGAVIMDPIKMEMIILMDQQKMYMVKSLPKPTEVTETKAQRNDISFEKTGVTEKICGYNCTKYLAKSKDGTSEIWGTDQLGTFLGTGSGATAVGGGRGRALSSEWEKEFLGKDFFPLRTVFVDKNGKETMRMEATSVAKQSLPISLFQPPADYKKFEIPNMGEMMKGMFGR